MDDESNIARRITDAQKRVYGYIYSLVGSSSSSWDILQETNLVLWRKHKEAVEVKNFEGWAFTIARFQVMAYLRDRKREPLSVLTPELVEQFAEDAKTVSDQMAERLEALRRCKRKLTDKSRQLLELYYEKELSLQEVGLRLEGKPNALKQALHRVRRSLQTCIESALADPRS